MIKTFASIAAAGVALVGVSNAAVIDFTIDGAPVLAGSFDGVNYTVTTEPADSVNNSQLEDGVTCETVLSALACIRDGFGVGADDEVSSGERPEMIKISFDDEVLIVGFAILDLFKSTDGQNFEVGEYSVDGGMSWMSFGSIANEVADGSNSGVLLQYISTIASSIWFRAPNVLFNNDNLGVNDFAVAGLKVSQIPVPGAAVLLLTGMAGFGFASRKRKAA